MYKDQVIKTGIRNGDKTVLTHFYRDNIRYIRGYILGNEGSVEDVEDVFQDALLALYQKLRSDAFEIRVPLRTYFYGICKNLWRSRLRKMEKLIVDDEYHAFKQAKNEPEMMDVQKFEQEYLYQKHFEKLSSENQNLLFLFFEGRSMREIAQITGYTEKYARKKKFDAKKQLLEMIEDDPMYRELAAC